PPGAGHHRLHGLRGRRLPHHGALNDAPAVRARTRSMSAGALATTWWPRGRRERSLVRATSGFLGATRLREAWLSQVAVPGLQQAPLFPRNGRPLPATLADPPRGT